MQQSPDYGRLVKFLLTPFASQPETVAVDCEYMSERSRVWLRVALSEADTPNVLGRGGRNLHAIRTILDVAASAAGQSVYLDLYGMASPRTATREFSGERPQRSNGSRPTGGGRRPSDPSSDRDRPDRPSRPERPQRPS
jgi:uncharacterized protein